MESVKSAALPGAILQLKVRLLGTSPMIWRRVLVPESVSLRELHGVVQLAMGWEGLHPPASEYRPRAGRLRSANSWAVLRIWSAPRSIRGLGGTPRSRPTPEPHRPGSPPSPRRCRSACQGTVLARRRHLAVVPAWLEHHDRSGDNSTDCAGWWPLGSAPVNGKHQNPWGQP